MRGWFTGCTAALIVCVCSVSGAAGSVSLNSWRPYSDPLILVTLGMTKGEVLVKAGQPATTEIISLGTDGFPSIAVWTYIRHGLNAEVANLTFSGNRLVRIELHLL